MAFDFRAWLKIQPDDVHYNFMNTTGECAIGKCMKAHGEKWDIDTYQQHVRREFDEDPKGHSALVNSSSFGELKRALELV